jgi:predicted ribosome quality control (RQC) complex YloA/Tae2 family protein
MLTDWVLIRRLGFELEERLRGARVLDAGLMADGRVGIAMRSRGESVVLAVDAFSSPPLVTVENGELAVMVEPGFVRALATALRGMVLLGVRARKGDRLLRLTFGSRSRFGVTDQLELYLELVPRFGNLVLVKGDRIVAAAKEFSLAENAARAIEAGLPYTPPPLPANASLVPKLMAQGGVDSEIALAWATGDDAMRVPLHVYREGGSIAQVHVVALPQFADAQVQREPSLLDVFAEFRTQRIGRGEHERTERRRLAAIKRLDERERKLRDEIASLDAKRRRAMARDELRAQGESIFASLHELDESARDEAKERANELFTEYKKLGASLPHIDTRESRVYATVEAIEALRWEAQRAGDREIDDVEQAVAELEPGRTAARRARITVSRKRKRSALEFRTDSGSRIVVGRSPIENDELTFRHARPQDLWFHARGIPGAHVVLARDDRSEPPEADLEAAAALAAFYSKATASVAVAVDYTPRKHVRKQRDAPPGLVHYTHAKTITVRPRKEIALS